MTRVRVASYNTRDFLDDRRAAARVVRAIDPDILCLQEVPRRLGASRRVRRFAAECGLRWVGRHRGSGGTTIFVSDRVRLTSALHHRLPVRLLDRTRGYAVAHLAIPGWPPLTTVSLHLSLRPGERVLHADAILAGIAAAPGAAIIAGDLNELDDGPAYGRFASPLRVVSPGRPTFPVCAPRLPLDVVFATPDLRVVEGPEVVLEETDVRAASDHRPVWVDLVPASPASGTAETSTATPTTCMTSTTSTTGTSTEPAPGQPSASD